jgi:predicted MPP superfamily phosphohydrolase
MTQALLIYHTSAALFTGFLLYFLSRIRAERAGYRAFLLLSIQLSMLMVGAVLYPLNGFGRIQLLVWGVFLYFPVFLLGTIILIRKSSSRFAVFLGIVLAAILLITVDAFLIEPRWLEVSYHTIESSKIDEPIRIAVLADLQNDKPGQYEVDVLERVRLIDPDLILLTGDYVQIHNHEEYLEAGVVLNEIFREAGLDPGLGVHAIRGNVDWSGWEIIFQDLDVNVIQETETFDLGPIALTGIGLLDSERTDLRISGSQKYHIVMGHSPNFSLGEIDGNLLLAGHTHGGQVQLPGIGPILTLSEVPRSWASGKTVLGQDQVLLVSRGIGLERGDAPRLRFLCRPELVIIDLQPPSNKP